MTGRYRIKKIKIQLKYEFAWRQWKFNTKKKRWQIPEALNNSESVRRYNKAVIKDIIKDAKN